MDPNDAHDPGGTVGLTTLIDSRCPLCTWTGTTDSSACPECGHGLVEYEVTLDA
jgi:hypothetical protein